MSTIQFFSISSSLPALRRASATASSGHGEGRDEGQDVSGADPGTGLATQERTKTKSPRSYRVLILNDDYTPMDFVVHVLQKFFQKEYTEATRIMLQVHQRGAGVAGVFTYEIAETKVYQVNQYARQNRHPLKCAMEPA